MALLGAAAGEGVERVVRSQPQQGRRRSAMATRPSGSITTVESRSSLTLARLWQGYGG